MRVENVRRALYLQNKPYEYVLSMLIHGETGIMLYIKQIQQIFHQKTFGLTMQ